MVRNKKIHPMAYLISAQMFTAGLAHYVYNRTWHPIPFIAAVWMLTPFGPFASSHTNPETWGAPEVPK